MIQSDVGGLFWFFALLWSENKKKSEFSQKTLIYFLKEEPFRKKIKRITVVSFISSELSTKMTTDPESEFALLIHKTKVKGLCFVCGEHCIEMRKNALKGPLSCLWSLGNQTILVQKPPKTYWKNKKLTASSCRDIKKFLWKQNCVSVWPNSILLQVIGIPEANTDSP